VADSCNCGVDYTHVRIVSVTEVNDRATEQLSSSLRAIPERAASSPAAASIVVYYTIDEPKSMSGMEASPRKLFDEMTTSVNTAVAQGSFAVSMLDHIDRTVGRATDNVASLDISQPPSCSLFPSVSLSETPMFEPASATANYEYALYQRRRLDVIIGASVGGVIGFLILILLLICLCRIVCAPGVVAGPAVASRPVVVA
jgi:hypothetical protein